MLTTYVTTYVKMTFEFFLFVYFFVDIKRYIIFSRKMTIYSHSYLGLGLMAARDAVFNHR